MSIRLGCQIPNFTYPDTAPTELFGKVVAQAQAAERSGFDTVLLMDHFYQLPGIGPASNEMLECYTALGALASAT
jgi:alkanesulfonate monooxygenase SsuD/methylene tetrahydromethanopterin reductase-like flavin-dependent oxidoreductase (luciferase family)